MGGEIGWFQCGFRFGGAELQPVPVRTSGSVLAVRPSWSFVATVAGAAGGKRAGNGAEGLPNFQG